jgi:hypothetical protein
VDSPLALVFAADATTAVAAGFNAAWLTGHWIAGDARPRGRRLAAVTLAVLNAGIGVQAAFAQALFIAHRFALPTAPFFAAGPWLAARLLLLAGTLMLSILILRRAAQ